MGKIVAKNVGFRAVAFLFLLTSPTLYGQNITFTGIVKDSLHRPLYGANILLEDSLHPKEIQFTTTDKRGQFSFNIPEERRYRLSITYLGYKSLHYTFFARHKNISNTFVLNENISRLPKVYIKTHPNIIRKKDTVVYRVEAFKKGTESNIEDVLRELPGISVGANGAIYIGHQEIEKILIDGEDFLSNRYRLISKNLSANFIDTIEIYSKYQENKLLKGIVESHNKAINLKLKKEYKQVWFGNINTGHDIAGRDYYKLHLNLMKLGRSIKHYFIGNINNKGESVGYHQTTTDLSTLNKFESVAQNQNVAGYTPLSGFKLPLKDGRYQNRKLRFANYNNIIDLSKNVTLTNNIIGRWKKIRLGKKGITRYVNGLNFTNTKSSKWVSKNFSGAISTSLKARLSSSENLKIIGNYTGGRKRRHQSNFFNTTFIPEHAKVNKDRYDVKANYINRVSAHTLFGIVGRYIGVSKPEDYRAGLFLYNNLLPDYTGDSVAQILQNSMKVWAVKAHLIHKNKRGTPLKFDVGFLKRSDPLKSKFTVFEEGESTFPPAFQNHQKFTKNDFYIRGAFQREFGHFQLKLRLSAHHIRTRLRAFSQKKHQQHNLLKPHLFLGYKINDKQQIGFSYAKNFTSSSPFQLNEHYILTGLRSFSKGFAKYQQVSSNSWHLQYRFGKWMDPFNFNFRLGYSLDHDYFTPRLFVQPNYILLQNSLAKHQKRWLANARFNYFVKALSTNIRIRVNYLQRSYKKTLNATKPSAVRAQSWTLKTDFSSSFSGIFNYTFGANYRHSKIRMKSQLTANQLKAYAGLSFSFSQRLSAEVHFDHLRFFNTAQKTKNSFLDFKVHYKVPLFSQNLAIYLEGSNLLNKRHFNKVSISDTFLAHHSFRLLPRMVFLGVNWRF